MGNNATLRIVVRFWLNTLIEGLLQAVEGAKKAGMPQDLAEQFIGKVLKLVQEVGPAAMVVEGSEEVEKNFSRA